MNENELTVESANAEKKSRGSVTTSGHLSVSNTSGRDKSKETSLKPHSRNSIPGSSSNLQQSSLKRYPSQNDTSIKIMQKSKLPRIQVNPEAYLPMPYIFRIPAIFGHLENQRTRCPPFYVQLDHTISVIWSLYSKTECCKPLGINQLQWALAFLYNIKNEKGRYPRDVAHCIETISDELIKQYSELVDDVKSMRNHKDKVFDIANEAVASTKIDIPPQTDQTKVDKPEVSIIQDVPFSINYAEMIHRSPSKTQQQKTDLFNDPSGAKKLHEMNDEECKAYMLGFLSKLRKDQMEKIYMELERLKSIETYIGNTSNNVQPYMDDKDKEIHVLIGEKLKQSKMKSNTM